MNQSRSRSLRGFSLVELLAVVLILAVLAAVAIPLYLNTRKTSAARACKANIAAIATAESTYALRNSLYTDMATLVAASPEGLATTVKCPLDSAVYKIESPAGTAVTNAGTKGVLTITCPNDAVHTADMNDAANSPAGSWTRTMSAIGGENAP